MPGIRGAYLVKDYEIETQWAIDQLVAIGLVKQKGEYYVITEAGLHTSQEILMRLDIQHQLLLMMRFGEQLYEELKEGG